MAGLSSGSREETGSSREMVDYFVIDYKPAASFVIAMLVVAELKRGRIALTEEAEVRDMFRGLVDGKGENGLTTEGMNRLNAYANGGPPLRFAFTFTSNECGSSITPSPRR